MKITRCPAAIRLYGSRAIFLNKRGFVNNAVLLILRPEWKGK